jgi:hypothetical protein
VRHSGQSSMRMESESAGLLPTLIQRRIPVVAGHTYRLSAWMRSDTPGVRARCYAEWVREGTFHSAVLPWVEPGPAWSEQKVTFVTSPDPEGALYLVLQVDGRGRVWFDDVRLDRID